MLSTILFVLTTAKAPVPAPYTVKPFRGDVLPSRVSGAALVVEMPKPTRIKLETVGDVLPPTKPKGYPF